MELKEKLSKLPLSPGVYFHKDKNGEVIYVGKAAVLRNRVKQYFHNYKNRDIKTQALITEIVDTDWIETESEIDALFLEAEMVKRYMPRFNILLRDDKSQTYVRIDMNNEWPHVSFTRNPADDGADYFGPYYNSAAVKKALRYLRKIFPYYIKPRDSNKKPDLYDHIGLSPLGMTSVEYKANLHKLISYMNGKRKQIINELETDMKNTAMSQDFEKAAKLRNKLSNLRELQQRIMFGNKEFIDISKDFALNDLAELLNLPKPPVRIEGYDISHISGSDVVASMVVFKNGVSDRAEYRKFKTRTNKNDDFYNMNETISRRLSSKNLKSWGAPDLIVIDGGKGQLDAAIKARDKAGFNSMVFISLAKKEEQIVVFNDNLVKVNQDKLSEMKGYLEKSDKFLIINLPNSTHIIKLLQRIRDESHRFAVSYHSSLKIKKQTSSLLDDIPGIGGKSKTKLIRRFGSISGIKKASLDDIEALIGQSKAKMIYKYIKNV